MVTLIQLEYIIAVDTYKQFVTASEKCFVTQPTLSMQIKKMEEELGVIIFDRSKQPVMATDIGRKIIDQARTILAQSQRIYEIIADHNDTMAGDITIGIIPSIAPYLLPKIITSITQNYPEINFKVKELLTEDIIKELKLETIDVGILVTPLEEKGIIEQPLYYEEIVMYVNKEHPYASLNDLSPIQLSMNDLWLLNNGHCFRSQVLNLCVKDIDANPVGNFEYSSGSLETIKKMVDLNGGYTLLPGLSVDGDSNHGIIKKFADPIPLREVSFVYTRNYLKKRIINMLSEEIKTVIPREYLDDSRGVIAEWRVANYK